MKVNAVAILAIMTAGLAFGDITVGPGDVLQVGTTGTGPNNANDNSVITLEAGATLKGVNEPSWSTWTIWRNLYATNGVAYLDCSDMTPEPRIRRHAVLTDGLVVKGRSSVMFFDDSSTTPNADWYIRDLSGVSFEGGGGSIAISGIATLVATPADANVTCSLDTSSGKAVAIAGPNLRVSVVQDDPADFTWCEKAYLFDDSYIPEGHSIAVSNKIFRIHPAVVDRAARKWKSVVGSGSVTHPISLSGGTLELCAPQNATYEFAGKVSGSGTINLRRDLAPSITSCSFAEIDGQFAFQTGVGGRTLSVTVEKIAPGSVLEDGGAVNLEFPAEIASRVQTFTLASGTIRYVMPDEDGRIPAEMLPEASRKLSDCAVMNGEVEVVGMPTAKVAAAGGACVTISHDGSRTLNVAPGEGTVSVSSSVSESLPLYWFDASQPYGWASHGNPHYAAPGSANGEGKDFGDIIMTNSFPYVEAWNDWRGETSGRFHLGRYYQAGENKFYPHSYPFLAVGAGPRGLNYLDFGVYDDLEGAQPMTQTNHADAIVAVKSYASKRRIDFVKSATPEMVIMVFGSQKGGGCAVLGTGSSHTFQRGRTLSDPIVNQTPANTTFWLDGVAVADPSQQTFNGGWQILSISGAGVRNVVGIGYDNDYRDAGGQNYGEIIFFESSLDDAVRRRYERYLALKWGVGTYPEAGLDAICAEGRSGTLEMSAGAGAELKGTFAGTVVLKGGTVKICEPLPPTADEIPVAGLTRWYDADSPGAVVLGSATSGGTVFTNLVNGLLARGETESTVRAGDAYLYGAGARTPFAMRMSRGLAAERTWIDFNHPPTYEPAGDDGNNLRFSTFDASCNVTSPAQTVVPQTFRTAFMAMDSTNGGGSPFLSTVAGGNGDFQKRDGTGHTVPLWSASCSGNVKNGVTRVNGESVDGTSEGALTGSQEVLTLVAGGDVSMAVVDYYGNSQSTVSPKVLKNNGIVFGELLLYSGELGMDDISRVEAYLQGKWTGTLPAGYSDLRMATFDGEGEVVVADTARMPRIASSFAGTVKVDGGSPSFSFGIGDDGSVIGAVVTPEVVYDLPSPATLTVNASNLCPPGRYELLVCKGFVRPMEWILDVKSSVQRRCRVVAESKDGVTRVSLRMDYKGTVIFVL